MRFRVVASFTVEFVDLDANERGIRVVRRRLKYVIEADNETEAAALVAQRIRHEYPVCWRMTLGQIRIDPLRIGTTATRPQGECEEAPLAPPAASSREGDLGRH